MKSSTDSTAPRRRYIGILGQLGNPAKDWQIFIRGLRRGGDQKKHVMDRRSIDGIVRYPAR
jgi:hypothetical protein